MRAQEWMDPEYVQVSKKEAADILGISWKSFDKRRASDKECPKGFKSGESKQSTVRFKLSDIYAYSIVLMKRSQRE